jgi:hypothetical protein
LDGSRRDTKNVFVQTMVFAVVREIGITRFLYLLVNFQFDDEIHASSKQVKLG